MIGVTADTNVYISAFIFSGTPRQFLRKAEAGRFQLAISQPILDELHGVLREKFDWSQLAIQEAISHLAGCTKLVHSIQQLDFVPADSDETVLLNAR